MLTVLHFHGSSLVASHEILPPRSFKSDVHRQTRIRLRNPTSPLPATYFKVPTYRKCRLTRKNLSS